ncbi:MAG: FAD-binding oxidoreductase, partial [Saprospiraceae bacterium]|nr:FAD-binding oxidoreductase [Saprospiraceae bacterium]
VPLVGIEPSAILSLRDEWKRLIDPERLEELESLNQRVYTIEEFLSLAYRNGEIGNDNFRKDPVRYHVHAHCHFKAQCEENDIYHLMDIVPNAEVSRIPSGCCGMAGSFGYEKEHYDVSMKVGEQELFPYLRNIGKRDSVIANGTSCRHQIEDALQIGALHPVEALWSMLK